MKFLVFLISIIFIGNLNAKELENSDYKLFKSFIDNLGVVNLDFEQTKKIPNIKKEFKNSGKLKFIKNKGLIWKEEAPNNLSFIATKKCYLIKEGNEIKNNDNLNNLPHFDDIKNLIDKILNNDLSELKETFNVDYNELINNSWNLTLTPKILRIKRYIKTLKILGTRNEILNIEVHYVNKTIIYFNFSKAKVFLDDEIKC